MPRNIVTGQTINPAMQEAARRLRSNQTPEEQILWVCLRKRLNGWKFRRQQIIGDFIVDFYCHACGLVIELDGEYHLNPEQQAYDAARGEILRARGLQILRIVNSRIREDLDGVLADIQNTCLDKATAKEQSSHSNLGT